ncbi:MAG: AAA family ATPase, partial [Rhizonema sp. PD37]|nr:AAA family ATPase [Rhizonema sp. PD37]
MNPYYPEDVNAENEKSLQTLVRAIRLSQGEFSLILVRCNYAELRDRIIQRLREKSPVQIKEITLTASAKTLYSTILAELENENPSALVVFGLESVTEINKVLTSSKYVREEFRKNFTFPMLLWVNDRVVQKLNRLATDFANWATRIEFTLTKDELVHFLHQKTDEIFANDTNLNPKTYYELETARKNLQNCGQVLESVVEASLEFVIGLNYYLHNQIDSALEHYQSSLNFWQKSHHLERQGILLLHITLAYYRNVEQNPLENELYWQESRSYLQQCLDIFEKGHPDLVVKHISKLGKILRGFNAWEKLNNLARQALKLHQNSEGVPQQIAQDYGFLAEAALGQLRWSEAKQLATKALQILADVANFQPNSQGLYLFILATAEQRLGQIGEAISNLEIAIAIQESHEQYEPKLYISILDNLRSLYFEQGKYLEAFQIKQQKIQIEHKYGFRAFAGVNSLNSQQKIINVIPFFENQETIITSTINIPGREEDVKRLIKKISSTEHKLIVIHGQSGVGKSSLLLTGLIPTLQQQTIDGRDTLPILLRVYTDWIGMLRQSLTEAFEEVKGNKLSGNVDSIDIILKQMRKNADSNLLTVLIFDQFEEFFFVYQSSKKRQILYDFLHSCLNISYVKVILSLQEDYLHYLLEWERLPNTSVINNDILTIRNRYYLANFSIHDAKVVIQTLTKKSHFFLENILIDELVKDLASETGEVRPIELQIVGTQLQTDQIRTLQQYHLFGKKKKLFQRFLEELLRDCGCENERTAKLILYLLINSNDPRHIKTYIELKEHLSLDLDQLDLVLGILVKSGLVSLLPKSGIR